MTYYLGIDIGGTNTRLLAMNRQGKFLQRAVLPTLSWSATDAPLSHLADIITEHIRPLPEKPAGMMLGLPGILDKERDTALSLPFIPVLNHRKVAKEISQLVNIPAAMDKDVNHLHLWDLSTLAYMPQMSIGIYLGTGIGNSLWIKGEFYHGANGAAGEIGHIPWPGNHSVCPCGKKGCFETIASGHWLSRWAEKNTAPEHSIADVFTHYRQHSDIRQFIKYLGMLIASEINILDPEQLFLGGGVIAMRDFPKQALVRAIRKHLRSPYPLQMLVITFSLQTGDTGCQGACLAAQQLYHQKVVS